MWYYILVIATLLIFIFALQLFNRDLIEPAVTLSGTFFLACLLAMFKYVDWHLYDYQFKTMFLIIVGIISFVIGSLLAHKSVKILHIRINNINVIHSGKRKNGVIQIPKLKLYAITGISTIMFMGYLVYVGNYLSFGSLKTIIAAYRIIRSADNFNTPFYIKFIKAFLQGISSVYICIIANNISYKKANRHSIIMFLPIVEYGIICILDGNRNNLLVLIIGGVSCWYIINRYKILRINKKKVDKTFKLLIKSFAIGILLLLLFWLLAFFVKTNLNQGDERFISYIVNYISGAISSFNMYIIQGGEPPQWIGEETFVTLNNNLSSILGLHNYSVRVLEFRNGFGYSVVNIYTSFRRFYHDFGVVGVFALSFFQGYFFSALYKKIYSAEGLFSFRLILYCYLFHDIIYVAIEDLFYTSDVSFSGLFRVMVLFAVYKFLLNNALTCSGGSN